MEKVLYIIPTPIGNLEDITLRAIRLLKESDIVLAEDTRVTRKLFNHYNITTKMMSYHVFNEHQKTQKTQENQAKQKNNNQQPQKHKIKQ